MQCVLYWKNVKKSFSPSLPPYVVRGTACVSLSWSDMDRQRPPPHSERVRGEGGTHEVGRGREGSDMV